MSTAGISFTRKTLRPARGVMIGHRLTTAIGFDPVDFGVISALSQLNEIAFQEQVRRLCKDALSRSTTPARTEVKP